MNWLRGHAGLLCLLGAALGAYHTPVASIHVGVLQAVTAPDNLATGIIRTLKERPPTNVNVLHLKADSADEDDLAESARRMVAEEVDLIIALTRHRPVSRSCSSPCRTLSTRVLSRLSRTPAAWSPVS